MTSEEYEEVADSQKSDIIKAVVIGTGLSVAAALINLDWVTTHQVGSNNHSSGQIGLSTCEGGLVYHTSGRIGPPQVVWKSASPCMRAFKCTLGQGYSEKRGTEESFTHGVLDRSPTT